MEVENPTSILLRFCCCFPFLGESYRALSWLWSQQGSCPLCCHGPATLKFPHLTYPTSSFLILLAILVTPNSNYSPFFFPFSFFLSFSEGGKRHSSLVEKGPALSGHLPPHHLPGAHQAQTKLPWQLSLRCTNAAVTTPHIPTLVKPQSLHSLQQEPPMPAKPFSELTALSHNSPSTQHLAGPGLRSHQVAALITRGSGFQRHPQLPQR